jgi:starch-binding outer membrane protein, SusD/RagB family
MRHEFTRTHSLMRIFHTLGITVLALGGLAACNSDRLEVPEYNNPTPEGVSSDPLVALNLAAGGIIQRDRADHGGQILSNGIFGREAFNYTPTEGRNTTGYLVNPTDPTSFGSGNFLGRFQTLKNIQGFYGLIETATPLVPLTTAQVQAATGFAKTFEGLTFLHYISSRHNLGGTVVIPEDPTDIQPFVSRDSVYSVALTRLNEGLTALQAGGTTFPFQLTAGFAGFNTPSNFARFNRAIAARLLAYRGSLSTGATRTQFYTQALTALTASFITPGGPLATGVFHVFSTAAGDLSNPINTATSVNVLAHPSTTVDATAGDLRLSKTRTIAQRNAPGGLGIPTTVGFNRYADQSTPIPIIRNEELILLRAEARYFTADQAGALADLNDVRTRAGGLPALVAGDIDTESKFLDRLLYERRYSLLLEGHRWVDVRRFGRLNTLPLDLATHVRALQQVVPISECQARDRTGDPALKGPGCP